VARARSALEQRATCGRVHCARPSRGRFYSPGEPIILFQENCPRRE